MTNELAAVLEVISGSQLLLVLRKRLEQQPRQPLEGCAELICSSEGLCLERHVEILQRLAAGDTQGGSELERELKLLVEASKKSLLALTEPRPAC